MPRSLLSFLNYWIYFLTGSSFWRSPGFFPRSIKTPVSRKKISVQTNKFAKRKLLLTCLFRYSTDTVYNNSVLFFLFFGFFCYFLFFFSYFCFFLFFLKQKIYSDTHLAMRAGMWSKCFHLVNFWKHTTFLMLAISLSLFFGRVTKEGMICVTRISSSSKIFKTCIKILWTCSKIPSLVDIHVDWLNWFHFLILVGGQPWFFCYHL